MLTDNNPLRIAAVVRVSSEKQQKEASPETQETAIRKACGDKGFGEPHWYRFVEKATKRGLDPKERKHFEQLLHDAVANEFDAVMVYHPTRWGRNLEDAARALRIFNGCTPRKEFYVLTDRKRIDTAAGRQSMGFATVQAEGESDYLRERVMINKFADAEKGRWPCRFPWGLKQDAKTLQWSKVPGTQAIVDRVFHLIVHKGYSMEAMAAKVGHGNAQVWRQRFAQFGVPYLTLEKYETGEKRTFTYPDAPRRLSKVQLAQIQRHWDANSTRGKPATGKREGYEDYLLSDKLKCSCGTKITGVTRKDGRREYKHGRAMIKDARCCNAVPAKDIEDDVFALLGKLMKRPDLRELILKGQEQKEGRVDYEALIEAEQRTLDRIERERAELIALKSKLKSIDAHTLRTFGNQLSKLSTDQTKAEARVAQLQQEDAEHGQRRTRAQEVADVLAYLGADPLRWKDNKGVLLDALFGIGNCKGKEPGIYVTKHVKPNGRCDYVPAFAFEVDVAQAIQLIAAKVKPGELDRPRLHNKHIRGKQPNVIASTST
jgi:DNA invertase Pin-like site-specific DNA recombinase